MSTQNEQLLNKLLLGKTTLGVDIASTSLNVVQLARHQGQYYLLNSCVIPFTFDASISEERLVTRALAQIAGIFVLKKTHIVAVINSSEIVRRSFFLPSMPDAEIKNAIMLEVKNIIPANLDETYLDYLVINKESDGVTSKKHIAFAACPKNIIDQTIRLIDGGFQQQPETLIPISQALENIIFYNDEHENCEYLATLEMSSQVTECSIYHLGKLIFSRKLPVTGEDITKSLTQPLMSAEGKVSLTHAEAEEVKRKHQLIGSTSADLIDGKLSAKQLFALVRPELEQLITEVGRSFDFNRERNFGARVEKLILLGGAAQLQGFDEYCQEQLGVDVVREYPFEKFNYIGPEEEAQIRNQHKLTLALGAALDNGKSLNLMPGAERFSLSKLIRSLSLSAVITFVLAGCLLMKLGVYVSIEQKKEAWNYKSNELKSLNPTLERVKDQQLKKQFQDQQKEWSYLLRELSQLVPNNVYLTYLELKDGQFIIKGHVNRTQEEASGVAPLLVGMQQGSFKKAKLKFTQKQGTKEFFEIEAVAW